MQADIEFVLHLHGFEELRYGLTTHGALIGFVLSAQPRGSETGDHSEDRALFQGR